MPSKKPSKTPSIFIRFFFELLVEHILFFSRKLNSFHLKQELFTANLNKPWPRGNSFARHLSNPSLTKHCSIKKSNNWKKQQIEYCNCAYRNLALCPNCTHFIIYIYIYKYVCVELYLYCRYFSETSRIWPMAFYCKMPTNNKLIN